MNEQEQAELRALREEQRELTLHLRALDQRLARFERLAAGEAVDAAARAVPATATAPVSVPEAELPPPLPVLPALTAAKRPEPALIPRTVEVPPASPLPVPLEVDGDLRAPLGASESAAPAPGAATKKADSLEMRIGSTWIVYAGVVVLLTALAFGCVALYQNVVPHLGPAGKIALLYAGVGLLTGAAATLERSRQARENPRLRTYAQTVLAAGLAGVYYVTYAAHYFENLRVIQSSLVAGAALLAWTAFMVGLAHRRNSETLATVAILLAYYTAAINEGVAAFTLFANLALTGGVVFLLRRHLWRVFPFASLLATFGSYGFWTYYHSVLGWRGELGVPPVHAAHGPGGFWVEAAFLAVYWALFTWAAFTAEEGALPSLRRAGFVSLNNGAFYGLVTWLVLGEGPGGFWKWSLGLGVGLLALAEACRRLPRPADPRTEEAYLLQGVLLVTTGFVAYFDGWQLGLVLAAEAVTLLAAAGRRSSRLLLGCSLLAAALAFGWTMGVLSRSAPPPVLAPLSPTLLVPRAQAFNRPALPPVLGLFGTGVFLVGAAYLAQRLRERPASEGAPAGFGRVLRPAPALYALFGCLVWLVLIGERAPSPAAAVTLWAGAALALTASVYVLRIRAMPVYAQWFLAVGMASWLVHEGFQTFYADGSLSPSIFGEASRLSEPLPNWATLALLLTALALGHWWQRRADLIGREPGTVSRFFEAGDAVVVVGVMLLWFQNEVWWNQPIRGTNVAESAGLALVIFSYALATRYRALAVAAQGLLLTSVGFFYGLVSEPWHRTPWDRALLEPLLAVVPLLVVLGTLALARVFIQPARETKWMRAGTVIYELLATSLFLSWGGHYLPDQALFPVFALAGAVVFALGVEKRVQRWLWLSAVPTVTGLSAFFVLQESTEHANLLNLLGIAFLAGEQQFGRRRLGDRLPGWFPGWAQTVLMVAAVGCAWTFVTVRVERWHDTSVTLAAGWSVFAAGVFAAGWFLRERVYRWLALSILAATLGHIAWFDLTRLDSLGKAVSFFALAVVLLGVGFLYNKYQDKFRDFL